MTRRMPMRDLLRARIQPAIEQLVDQVLDMLEERIAVHLNQLELAFDATTSAFASDLSVTDGAARRNDVPADGKRSGRLQGGRETRRRDSSAQQGQDLPPSNSSTTAVSAVGESPRPTKRSQGAATPGQSASSAAGNVAEPHRAPSGPRDSDAADVDTSSRRICGCAARGRHRKDCSLPNVSTSPASDLPALTPPSSPATSPTPTTDKRARLAELKERQRQRERDEHPPALPQPTATFGWNPGAR